MENHPWSASIVELFSLEKGALIVEPDRRIYLAPHISITRRALRHIIESRKSDGYSVEMLQVLSVHIDDAMRNPGMDVPNTNPIHKNSRICGKIFEKGRKYLLVIYGREGIDKAIITAFYTTRRKFSRLST
jgi:hypothetical protein